MTKGEIYKLKNEFKKDFDENQYNHAFVYWDNNDHGINGIMLTTSGKEKYKNILMKKEHFNDEFEFTFGKSKDKDKSYIAPCVLFKDLKYDQLEKVGELTELGIDFIESKYDELQVTTWKDYIKNKSVD